MASSSIPDPFAPVDGPQSTSSSSANIPGSGMAPQPSTSSARNPFTDVLNHVSAFNTALARAPYDVFGPIFGSPSTTATSTTTTPSTATPFGSGPLGAPANPSIPPTTTKGPLGPPVNPSIPPTTTGPPGTIAPKPAGATYSDYAWQKANEWGSNPGYGYLISNPALIDQYTSWVASTPGAGNVDIVDWLAAHGYPSPNAGRHGYNTYAQNVDGTPTSWLQQPTTSPATPATLPTTTTPPTTTPGQTLPTTQPPLPVTPPPPPFPTTPTTTTPSAPFTPGTPPPVAPPDIQSLIQQYQQDAAVNQPNVEAMMSPMFARQQQLLQQQLEAQAALTPGRTQSGGFGANEAQAAADLSGQQSATLANALQQQATNQMQQNTALIGLGTQAGMQKYTDDINASLQQFQVTTNAGLQQWLDNSDNVLKKYGIDTSNFLAEYQSQLALQGQQYSADQSVNSAALYAAAEKLAAQTSASASMYSTNAYLQAQQLQNQLGIGSLNVTRENNIGNFILGLLQNGNVNLSDLNSIISQMPTGNTVVAPP